MNESSRRVTLKDIAEAAGLSKSAVSLALRNHPGMAAATRQRVRQLAEKLGYRPDPALTALSGYRHGRPPAAVETLAWVTNWDTFDAWRRNSPVYDHYFDGAARRAENLGYRLEHLWMGESGMSRGRFAQILHARNIRGLVLAPQPVPHRPVDLPWFRHAAVTIGYSISAPRLHMVACSHLRSMTTLLNRLRGLGYQRIGFALTPETNARVENAWLAAFLIDQRAHGGKHDIPPLLLKHSERRRFCQWAEVNGPDAVVTEGRRLSSSIRQWCADMGRKIPGDIGLAVVSNVPLDGDMSGIHEHSAEIGATAIDVLTAMLHRNELGLPTLPRRTLIDGEWVPGRTVRPVTGPIRDTLPGA